MFFRHFFCVYLLIYSSIPFTYGDFFAPISDYVQQFDFKGQKSSRRVITVPCTDANDRGVLNGGNFEVDILCHPPKYTYIIQRLSMVPIETVKGRARVCPVQSLDAVVDTFGNTSEITIGLVQNSVITGQSTIRTSKTATKYQPAHHETIKRHAVFHQFSITHHEVEQHFHRASTASFTSHHFHPKRPGHDRKLLQDVVGTVLGIAALVQNDHLQSEIDRLWDKADAQDHALNLTNLAINELNVSLTAVTDGLATTQRAFQTSLDIFNETQKAFQSTADGLQRSHDALAALQASTQQSVNNNYQDMQTIFNTLQNRTDAQDAEEHRLLIQTQKQLVNSTLLNNQRFNDVNAAIFNNGNQALSTVGNLAAELRGESIQYGFDRVKFDTMAQMPDGLMPLYTDPGLHYNDNGLVGPKTRVLVDKHYITYVINENPQIRAVVTSFSWYMESQYAIVNVRPYSNIYSLMTSVGNTQCVRPYADSVPFDTIDTNGDPTNLCKMWMEEVTLSCHAISNNFVWNGPGNDLVDNTVCVPGSIRPADRIKVYRSVADIYQRQGEIHTTSNLAYTGSNAFYIASLRMHKKVAVQTPRNGSDAFLGPITASQTLSYMTIQSWSSWLLSYAYRQREAFTKNTLEEDVKNLKLLVYGRAFDGTYDYPEPVFHTPIVNGTNGIVPNEGARPSKCQVSEFYWVSPIMVPIQAAVPQDVIPSSARVEIKTITGIGTGNPALQVTTSDVELFEQWTARAAHLVPDKILMMGEVNGTNGYIFNVPPDLICASNDEDSCFKKIGFFGDTDITNSHTPTLTVYNAKNNDRFHPSKMGPNPVLYARRVTRDDRGLPLCIESGSISTQDLLFNTQGQNSYHPTCLGTLAWYNATTNSPTPNTLKCNAIVDQGTYWYKDNTAVGISGILGSSLAASWALAFVYQTSLATPNAEHTLNIITLVTNDRYKLTITSGNTLTVTIGSQVATVNVYHNNLNGNGVHTVWVQWSHSLGILSIYVDSLLVLTTTGFFYSTGSDTPAVQIFDVNRTPGVGATIFLMRFYGFVLPDGDVKAAMGCLASFAPTARCDAPVGSPPVGFADSRTTLQAYQVPTQGCTAGNSALLSDPTDNSLLAFQPASDWAVSFWLDHMTLDPTIFATLLDFGSTIGWSLSATTPDSTHTKFQFTKGSTIVTSPLINLGLDPSSAHYIVIRSTGGSLEVLMDTGSAWIPSGVVFGTAADNLRSQLSFAPQAVSGRWYSVTLNTTGLGFAYGCELQGLTPQQYRNPLATCVLDDLNPSAGYCRHPSMCAGHCQAYTTDIRATAKTFHSVSYVCDPGFSGINCLTPCTYSDQNGYCVTTQSHGFNINVTGEIPNGQLCQLYKHFRVYEEIIDGLRVVQLEPKYWTNIITVKVPLGNSLTSELSQGVCPVVSSAVAIGNQTLVFKLTNPGSVDTQVRIKWTNVGGNQYPQDSACADQFATSLDIVVPANFPRQFQSPPCNNTQIQVCIPPADVNDLTCGTPCGSPIKSTFFPELIQIAQNYPDIVIEATAQVKDTVTIEQNKALMGLYLAQLQFNIIAQRASGASQALIGLMQEHFTYMQNVPITNVPINITALIHQPVVIGGRDFKANLDALAADATAVSNFNISVQLNSLQGDINAIGTDVNNSRAALVLANEYNSQARFFIDLAHNITLPAGITFGDFVGGIAKGAANAVVATANAAAGGISGIAGLMNSIFGIGSGIGGFFTGLITYVLYGVILFAMGYLAYYLYQRYKANKEKKDLQDMVSLRSQVNQPSSGNINMTPQEKRPLLRNPFAKSSTEPNKLKPVGSRSHRR